MRCCGRSSGDSRAGPPVADLAGWLARRRVALGFACGAAALWLSRPSWTTWTAGCAIALAGEMVRIWAAGHVEKNREVTASGPYRFSAHPLYVGSAIIGVGFAVSAASPVVAVLVGAYLAATIGAAIRREEQFLRGRFGDRYEAYRAGRGADRGRRFSFARAMRNKEYRAIAGFLALAILLALKARAAGAGV